MTTFGTENESRRKAWVTKTLQELPAEQRILDAGAGEQTYRDACKHLKYVSQDFAKYDGQGDNRGLQMEKWDYSELDIISDITKIPEPDCSFDAVLCSEVMEHIPDPIKALKEFHRLLRPDGVMIITAPFCSLTHFSPYHYHSGFNRYFYEKTLPDIGFELLELESNGNFFEYLAQEIHRYPQVASQYSGTSFGLLYRLAAAHLLRCLKRSSQVRNNSDELLCFGYHVKAIKSGISKDIGEKA